MESNKGSFRSSFGEILEVAGQFLGGPQKTSDK